MEFFFFLNDPPPTEISTLPLPDALPIFGARRDHEPRVSARAKLAIDGGDHDVHVGEPAVGGPGLLPVQHRSEEHTSELQSQSNLVCRLLLVKKNRYRLSRTARLQAPGRI